MPDEPIKSLIVEFVGPPGVGKSAISHALAELLLRERRHVSESTYELARQPGSMGLRQLRYAARLLVKDSVLSSRWIRVVANGRLPDLRRTATRTLDLLYSCALLRQHATRQGVHVFDQGVLQSIASILYSSRRPPDEETLVSAAYRTYAIDVPVVVVFVQAPPEVAMQRLRRRPGSEAQLERIESPDGLAAAVSRFTTAIDEVERIAAVLKKRLGERFETTTLSNGSEEPLQSAVDELHDRLVGMGCIP